MKDIRGRIGIVCAALALPVLAPVLAVAQDQPQAASIRISMSTTTRDGTTASRTSAAAELRPGEAVTQYVYSDVNGGRVGTGSQPPEEGARAGSSGVSGGLAGGVVSPATAPVAASRPQYDYLWQVDVRAAALGIDAVTLDVDWKRLDVKDGARQVVAGDHRTMTLRQGEKHVLDFVACPPESRVANVFVDVQAAPREDPAVADLVFSYDLWLVHQTADGVRVTRHAVVTGRQGEKVNFGFASLPLPIDSAAAPDADSPFRLAVSGTVVGRQRRDGTFEIAVQPSRTERFPTGRGGLSAGTKTFVAKAGETTSIALPADNGRSQWKPDGAFKVTNPRPGVSVKGEWVSIEHAPFFQGASTSILVTVHPEK